MFLAIPLVYGMFAKVFTPRGGSPLLLLICFPYLFPYFPPSLYREVSGGVVPDDRHLRPGFPPVNRRANYFFKANCFGPTSFASFQALSDMPRTLP